VTSLKRLAVIAAILAACTVAGCGGGGATTVPPASRIEALPGSSAGKIVLSATGAQRIGIETAPASRAGASILIPYSALVYDPSGNAYVFTSIAPLTYTEVPVTVDHIDGNEAYLTKGPTRGAQVVTVGAEELLGVQTGVLAQT
jgi:hypothetical protein